MYLMKRLAARLPDRWHNELKQLYFARQIRRGRFETDEKEFLRLSEWVHPGDWVLDIGANVGHYTCRLSELVGHTGRVIAFEPVPATFSLLTSNARLFAHRNVTLINAAASDRGGTAGIALPEFTAGLANFYQAHVSDEGAGLNVMTLTIDSLPLENPISLVKIDVEGHEAAVVAGMERLIRRCRPLLILETNSESLVSQICEIGYVAQRMEGSSNVLLRPIG
jgi:FkbM family methyltransferase